MQILIVYPSELSEKICIQGFPCQNVCTQDLQNIRCNIRFENQRRNCNVISVVDDYEHLLSLFFLIKKRLSASLYTTKTSRQTTEATRNKIPSSYCGNKILYITIPKGSFLLHTDSRHFIHHLKPVFKKTRNGTEPPITL